LKSPPSPGELPEKPPVRVIEPEQELVRFYRVAHGPWDRQRFFGPLASARFDHHHPPVGEDPERSVWYAARSLVGATAEADDDLSKPAVWLRVARASRRCRLRTLGA